MLMLAGRQGVLRIRFRPFATIRQPLPSLSCGAGWGRTAVSSAYFRLPAVAARAGAMSLEMALG
jgi:hypothetical protein